MAKKKVAHEITAAKKPASRKKQEVVRTVSEIAALLSFQSLRLERCEAFRRERPTKEDQPSQLKIDVKLQGEAHGQSEGPGMVVYVFDFGVVAPEKRRRAEVSVNASFRVSYILAPGEVVTEAEIDRVGQNLAIFTAWPYWRELVQSMTVRMELPPMPIPIIRLGDISKWEAVSSEEADN